MFGAVCHFAVGQEQEKVLDYEFDDEGLKVDFPTQMKLEGPAVLKVYWWRYVKTALIL